MKQISFADAEYAGRRKQTRKELFLIEMDQMVPWTGLVGLLDPYYLKGDGGRPAYSLMAMLRVHLMQSWFGYSDSAMEEALYETMILRRFAGLGLERIPDATSIHSFRKLLEEHELTAGILAVINDYLGDRGLSLLRGTIVEAILIDTPISTQSKGGQGDPKVHQTPSDNTYNLFAMKAHTGADPESLLVRRSEGRAANVVSITQANRRRHSQGANAGYTDCDKRAEHEGRQAFRQFTAYRSNYQILGKHSLMYRMKLQAKQAKAHVQTKIEALFRVGNAAFEGRNITHE